MKTILSWFRWKYVVPLLVVIAAIIIFFVLFFDPLLARGIETFGGKANGAKVEVAGLKTKIFQGRLSIAHLQVADPDIPMQNRLEAGPLAFQLDLGELAGKRVIINEATLKGLTFDSPRKTSGALPKPRVEKKDPNAPPSAAEKLAEKYKERFKLNIDGITGEAKSRIEFDPKDLELYKSAEALKAKSETLPDEWKKRVQTLDVDNRLKKAEADLKAIRETPTSGPDALTAIPNGLKKLKQVKSDLDALKKDVQDAKGSFIQETKNLKASVTDLSQAKKKDVDGLMSRLNLDFASPERLVEGLVGPMVLHRFRTALHYIQLARQYMPPKKEKEVLPPKPRVKGMDIEFPTPAALPRFWLQKAALDGVYQSIAASGSMSNLTTDAARVGKPFLLDMIGQQAAQTYSAKVSFDHTKDLSNDTLAFRATGLDVRTIVPADNADFSAGTARMDVTMAMAGESNIGGTVDLGLSALKFDDVSLLKKVGVNNAANLTGGDKIKADFMRNVAHAIEGMKEVGVTAQITGTWSDPDLKFSSNLGSVLSNVIKDSVGNLVKDQRAQLEARLNTLLAEKQKEVTSKISGLDSIANGQLGGIEEKIQQKISEAAGIGLSPSVGTGDSGIKIPSLNKLFKH